MQNAFAQAAAHRLQEYTGIAGAHSLQYGEAVQGMGLRQIPLQGRVLSQSLEYLCFVKKLLVEKMGSVAGFYIRQKMLYARSVLYLARGQAVVDHIGNRKTQLPPALIVYPALDGSAAGLQRFRGEEIDIGALGVAGVGQLPAEHRNLAEYALRLIRMVAAHQHSNHRPQPQRAAACAVGSVKRQALSYAEPPGECFTDAQAVSFGNRYDGYLLPE